MLYVVFLCWSLTTVCARYILYVEFSVSDTFCIFNSLLVIYFLFAICVGDTYCIFAVSVYVLFPYAYFTGCAFTKLRFAVMISNELSNFGLVQKQYISCFWIKSLSEGFVGGFQRRRTCSQSVAVGGSSQGVARLENTQLRLGC